MDLPDTHNLTSIIGQIDTWDEEGHLTQLLLSILSIGVTISPECWLKFPIMCIGCNWHQITASLQHTEYHEVVTTISTLCNLINGFIPENIEFERKDWFVLQKLRRSAQYEPNLRPNFPKISETVNVTIQLVTIENLDLSHSSFKLDFLLRQEWNDHRLRHHHPAVLDGSNLRMGVWVPDSYFVQAKRGAFSRVAHDGQTIKVKSNGDVSHGARITLEVSCPIDLRNFPMDIQHCNLDMESYAYTTEEITYNWSPHEVIMKNIKETSKSLSQYTLEPIKTGKGSSEYVLGNWSKLQIEFKFVRNSIIFIPAMYFPCAMVVFITWITFLMDSAQYPARTYLCVTSLLTIVTLQTAMNASLPKVSYVKAIDKYIVGCILFVAGAFLEYAVVLLINIKKNSVLMENSSLVNNNHDNIFNNFSYALQPRSEKSKSSLKKKLRRRKITFLRSRLTSPKEFHDDQTSSMNDQQIVLTKFGAIFHFYLSDAWPKKLDVISRVFFPSLFLTFNLFYWITHVDDQY
uniref:Uncharacterized protein n=2 Tax=Clytia hemisphaerica TaxID=252671 RepID=A0A7M5X2L3_9CNID